MFIVLLVLDAVHAKFVELDRGKRETSVTTTGSSNSGLMKWVRLQIAINSQKPGGLISRAIDEARQFGL